MLRLLVKFRAIDRRWISTLVIVLLALPMFVKVPLKMYPFPETYLVKETIDALPKDKLILIACDWEAGTQGECDPLTTAVMDYLMREGRPFAIFSLVPQGPELAGSIAEELGARHHKTYGTDWINIGYRPQIVPTLIGMMNDLPGLLKTDVKDQPLTSYAMMAGVRTLKDVGLVYEVTGTGLLDAYLQFCGGVTLAQGCTAVVGPEEYTYIQSGQLKGLLVGLGGAAQFEVVSNYQDADGSLGGKGMRGMGSQSLGHLLVMLLIILGNLGAWAAARAPSEQLGPLEAPFGQPGDEEGAGT